MNIRESMELREQELLSPFASHSTDTRGRDRPEEECDVRTAYQRDRDRILHCKDICFHDNVMSFSFFIFLKFFQYHSRAAYGFDVRAVEGVFA